MKYLESYEEHEPRVKRVYTKLTQEELAKIAKKYTSRRDFRNDNPNAYSMALKKGILNTICSHMDYLQKKWSDKDLENEAKKYKTRREFRKNSPSAYVLCTLRNLLDKFDFLENNIGKDWTLESLKAEANKYKTIGEFRTNSPDAYINAYNRDVLDIICTDLINDIGEIRRWKLKDLKAEAKMYKTRYEFNKGSKKAYLYAYKKGLLDIVCAHMKPVYPSYTEEDVKEAAKKYSSRTQFKKHDNGLYRKAIKLGILDKVCGDLGY